MSKVLNGATKWQLVLVFLLEGFIIVHSSNNVYANVGDNISITCPSDKVYSWTFLKTDDILAFCNGNKEINKKSNISNRLHISPNCTLRITKFKNEDVGMYKCSHPSENINGMKSHITNIQLPNDPFVSNTNQVFSTGYKPRNLKCEVSGVPNIFKFNKWRHLVNGHHVRFLDGNNDGTLTLPYINTSDIQYDDSGLYICNVSNGIQNENGQLWQTGTVNVTIKNKPMLAKLHKQVYIGHNTSTTTVALYLLSSSELSSANWVNEGNSLFQTTQCAATTVNTNFHGTPVNVSGYVCNFSITETEERNFQNYSVTVSNDCCSNTFNFSIKSAREPVKPNVLGLIPSTYSIYVLLEPGSDGGRHQEFIIEYRKQQKKKWEWLLVENVGTSELSCYIPSLDPSTGYEIRILARNSIGNSSSTNTYKVWTKDEKKYKGYTIVIIIVTTVVTVCFIIICWRRRKAEKIVSHRSQTSENVDQGGAIENSLYQSANDLTEPSTVSANVEIVNRSIDKRKPNVNRQIVGYNIVGKDDSMRPLNYGELKYKEEKNIRYDSSTLNYVEVVFDPGEHKSKFHIHGAENRTPYADIDFSLTADPLTSSDEESLSSPEDNNDFVSLEDVQQWNIHDS